MMKSCAGRQAVQAQAASNGNNGRRPVHGGDGSDVGVVGENFWEV